MLIFKGYKVGEQDVSLITLRYNDINITLKVGDKLDVRDFDIPNAAVVNVEKHLIRKNPGRGLEIVGGISNAQEEKELRIQIKNLNALCDKLKHDIMTLEQVNKELVDKHGAAAGEIQAMAKEKQSMKNELDRVVRENKSLEEEIERLRLRTTKKG